MPTSYPPQVQTFRLVGVLARGIGDTNDDTDELPELVPLAGLKVTCIAALNPPRFRVPTATPPVIVYQEAIYGTTDAAGNLIEATVDSSGALVPTTSGLLGIVLPWGLDPDINPTGWTWTITIQIGGNFPDEVFTISGDPTKDTDVSTLISIPANPGTDLSSWQGAVAATQANVVLAQQAVTAAQAAAAEAEQSAGSAGGVPNSLVYRQQNSDGSYPPVGTIPAGTRIVYIGTSLPPTTVPDKSLFFLVSV